MLRLWRVRLLSPPSSAQPPAVTFDRRDAAAASAAPVAQPPPPLWHQSAAGIAQPTDPPRSTVGFHIAFSGDFLSISTRCGLLHCEFAFLRLLQDIQGGLRRPSLSARPCRLRLPDRIGAAATGRLFGPASVDSSSSFLRESRDDPSPWFPSSLRVRHVRIPRIGGGARLQDRSAPPVRPQCTTDDVARPHRKTRLRDDITRRRSADRNHLAHKTPSQTDRKVNQRLEAIDEQHNGKTRYGDATRLHQTKRMDPQPHSSR